MYEQKKKACKLVFHEAFLYNLSIAMDGDRCFEQTYNS